MYAATSTVHDMYQSTHLTDASIDSGGGEVLFSTNQGSAWQVMHNFGHVVTWVQADPNNPDRLYASVANSTSGGIYVTNDAQDGTASVWTKLAVPPRTQGHAFNIQVLNDGTLVVTYSGRRDSTGAFTASSGVFVSTNGGQSWQDASAPGMLYWTKDITIDPSDPTQSTWYVSVFSGFGGPPNGLGGLYKTTNRGQTWTKINSLDRVNSLAIDPADPNQAYLTTEINGLWYTNNLQSGTPTFTPVTSYHFMQPMRVIYNPYNSNEIWVTSFGGGLRVGYTNLPGDFNLDGHVNASDVIVGMQALANSAGYESKYGVTGAALQTIGDVNGDGAFTNADMQALLLRLQSGGGSSSPVAGPGFSESESGGDQQLAGSLTDGALTNPDAGNSTLDSGRNISDDTFAPPPHVFPKPVIAVDDHANPDQASQPSVLKHTRFEIPIDTASDLTDQFFSNFDADSFRFHNSPRFRPRNIIR